MKIRQVRSELRMSQAEFARLLGVHQTAVSQWETGRTSPDLDALQRIAHYSGHSVDELLAPVSPDTLEIRMTDGGMRGARIEEGDTVCLRTGVDAVSDGQIAAVETDAGVFVRYLYHMGDRFLLVPASGGYPPLSVPATTPVLGRAYAFRSYL